MMHLFVQDDKSAARLEDLRSTTCMEMMNENALMPPPPNYGTEDHSFASPAHFFEGEPHVAAVSPRSVADRAKRNMMSKAPAIQTSIQGCPFSPIKKCAPSSFKNEQRQTSDGTRREREMSGKTSQRLRQRVLFLHHASTCSVDNLCSSQTCHLGPKCAAAKRLAAHVAACRNGPTCRYPHCVSSRYALSHYMNCTEKSRCHICGPVKRQIKQISSSPRKDSMLTCSLTEAPSENFTF
jgi:hypothetical protein